MKKLEQFVTKNWIFKLISPIIGVVIMTLVGTVYTQTLVDVQDNKNAIQAQCAKVDLELKGKVDNKHFDTLIQLILDEQKEQKIINKELTKTMQKLQVHMQIIKERIK